MLHIQLQRQQCGLRGQVPLDARMEHGALRIALTGLLLGHTVMLFEHVHKLAWLCWAAPTSPCIGDHRAHLDGTREVLHTCATPLQRLQIAHELVSLRGHTLTPRLLFCDIIYRLWRVLVCEQWNVPLDPFRFPLVTLQISKFLARGPLYPSDRGRRSNRISTSIRRKTGGSAGQFQLGERQSGGKPCIEHRTCVGKRPILCP